MRRLQARVNATCCTRHTFTTSRIFSSAHRKKDSRFATSAACASFFAPSRCRCGGPRSPSSILRSLVLARLLQAKHPVREPDGIVRDALPVEHAVVVAHDRVGVPLVNHHALALAVEVAQETRAHARVQAARVRLTGLLQAPVAIFLVALPVGALTFGRCSTSPAAPPAASQLRRRVRHLVAIRAALVDGRVEAEPRGLPEAVAFLMRLQVRPRLADALDRERRDRRCLQGTDQSQVFGIFFERPLGDRDAVLQVAEVRFGVVGLVCHIARRSAGNYGPQRSSALCLDRVCSGLQARRGSGLRLIAC